MSSSISTSQSDNAISKAEGNCNSVHDYKKMNRIGEGTYGFVYKAIHRSNGQVVALKRIILHHEQQDGFPLTSIREVKTLMRCHHPNIVQLLDVVVGTNRDAVFLLFEYCEHDMSELIKQVKYPFRESEIKRLLFQLLSAVEYIHKNCIIHRDIKLSNLLYNNRGQLKLADFGLARTMSRPHSKDLTQLVVTLWYRAPELLLGSEDYSFGVDIWSIGCIMGELLLYSPLFPGNDELDQLMKIFALLGGPNDRIWPDIITLPVVVKGVINLDRECKRFPFNLLGDRLPDVCREGIDLLNALLTYSPAVRISARNAVRHRFFHISPYPKEEDLMPTFPSQHDSKI